MAKRYHLNIFQLCIRKDIKIKPTWIPRELNQIAYSFSKMKDTDDWSMLNLNKSHASTGKPTYDRFANNLNAISK